MLPWVSRILILEAGTSRWPSSLRKGLALLVTAMAANKGSQEQKANDEL